MGANGRHAFCLALASPAVLGGCLSDGTEGDGNPDVAVRNYLEKPVTANLTVRKENESVKNEVLKVDPDDSEVIEEVATETGTYEVRVDVHGERLRYNWSVSENELKLDDETVEVFLNNATVNIGVITA